MASPGHALGQCKVKCTLCSGLGQCKVKCTLFSGQQVWWSMHWGLCLAVQVACVASDFVKFWSPSVMEAVVGNHCAQSPASVTGQPWACPGPLQGQMHPVQWSASLVEPALGAAAVLCN